MAVISVEKRRLASEIILIALSAGIFTCYFINTFDIGEREETWSNALTAKNYSAIPSDARTYILVALQICFVLIGLLNMWYNQELQAEKRSWSAIYLGAKMCFISATVLKVMSGRSDDEQVLERAWILYLVLVLVGIVAIGVGIALLLDPFQDSGIEQTLLLKSCLVLGVWTGQMYFIALVLSGDPLVGRIMLLVSLGMTGVSYSVLRVGTYVSSQRREKEEEETSHLIVTKTD